MASAAGPLVAEAPPRIRPLRWGPLGLTTVLISLYPAVTVVLAALFLRERIARAEFIGIGVALAAVTLLAVE